VLSRARYGTFLSIPLVIGALGCASSDETPGSRAATGGFGAFGASGGNGGSAAGSGQGGKGGVSGTSNVGGSSAATGCSDAPAETPLRRLSRLSYVNTLEALFGEAAVSGISAELGQLFPDGENSSVFTANDLRVTQRHVDAWYGVANALSRAVSSDSARLEALAGACAVESPLESACVRSFIESFGERAFRRPLTTAETDRYLELFDAAQPGAEVFRGILFTFLMSPQLLYQFETEGTPAATGGRLRLSAHELAARLSYHFWQAPPDDALTRAAADGSLLTDSGYQAEVERVFSDPRTEISVSRFFREWLGLEGFSGFVNTPAFTAFAQGTDADIALYDDMVEEIEDMVGHYVWDSDGSYADLLTSNLVFTRSSRVAALYGVSPWSGSGTPPSFPAGQRAGLLTRAALLVEGNDVTNPIKRGSFVLHAILCEDLAPPTNLPPDALTLPPFDPDQSTRQRFEAKTSPDECVGCHSVLNPLGFALESFDALGRYRTEERVFADDGSLANTVPVNPVVDLTLGAETVTVNDAVEYATALAARPETAECVARQYFRFTYRRHETDGDSCTVAAIRTRVEGAGSLREALKSVALEPWFREKVEGAP
jgi:hypothetical protein